MDRIRLIAGLYAVILALVTSLNYLPGLTDAQGRAFGIFALDIYDDALHAASAAWAASAALLSRRASELFLTVFGALYLSDGLMGLVTGSGYLDLGIFIWGWQTMPFLFKLAANMPHIALGGLALLSGLVLARRWAAS